MRFDRTSRMLLMAETMLFSSMCFGAGTFHVDHGFRGESPTGASWLSAFPTLQGAIDAAADAGGGEVWVKAGVHKPEGGSRNATIELKPGVELYGGFRGFETERDQRNPKANRTVLSGDIGRSGSPDNCYHVLTGASNARIDGFIISRGNANAAGVNRFGGGLILPAGSQNTTVANCTFEKNHAESGGGIHAQDATFAATNCTFYSNSAQAGGAVALARGARLGAVDCIFSSNFAPIAGGAVFLPTDSNATFTRSTFLYNSTDGSGGAIHAETDKEAGLGLELHHSTFRENSAELNGGALALKGPFSPVIAHCGFDKNHSTRGAGAIGTEAGISAIVTGTTFSRNKGIKSSTDINNNKTSGTVGSTGKDAKSEKVVVPEPKRKLAEVHVYNMQDIKVKLRSLVAAGDHTVLALGDLTDPGFIEHYLTVEAAARDYMSKGVHFFYIYRHLAHPGNNGYLKPFKPQERARHAKVAKEILLTHVPWLYDTMDNQAAEALGLGNANNLFIFSKEGAETYAGTISDASGLRKALETIAGSVGQPTSVDTLPKTKLQPINMPEAKLVKRIDPGSKRFQSLEITPLDSKWPHFVKMRAEGSRELLESGNGKLYLGFHIDPLYKVEWNNLSDPMNYALKVPSGVVAPSINSALRVTGQATDTEPREFLLEARKLDLSKPIKIQLDYSVHSTTSRRNIEVSQYYIIHLQPDRFGGQVFGRQAIPTKKAAAGNNSNSGGNAFTTLLRRFDLDRNGKLSTDEVIGGLRTKFNEIDGNKDGYIDEKEYLHYRENR